MAKTCGLCHFLYIGRILSIIISLGTIVSFVSMGAAMKLKLVAEESYGIMVEQKEYLQGT